MSRFVGHFPQNRIRIGQTSMLSYMYNYNLNCMLESWKEINNARFNSRQRFRYASFETQSIFTTLWRQKTKTTEKKNHKKSFVCTIKRLYKFIFHSIKFTYCTRILWRLIRCVNTHFIYLVRAMCMFAKSYHSTFFFFLFALCALLFRRRSIFLHSKLSSSAFVLFVFMFYFCALFNNIV